MADTTFPLIDLKSHKFDLDDAPKAHSDGKVIFACEADGDTFANDDALVKSAETDSRYSLTLPFRSESNVPLWNDGIIRFFYNKAEQSWHMSAVYGAAEWKFCNPDQVFDIVIAGLECAAGDQGVDVSELIASIRAQKDHIVSTSSHYETEDDCRLPTQPAYDAPFGDVGGY